MGACGVVTETNPNLREVDVYTSHEALILGYEEALTRRDCAHRRLVRLLGAHALDRRAHRDLDGAHVEFLRGVGNPDRLQGRPTIDPDEVLSSCATSSTRIGPRTPHADRPDGRRRRRRRPPPLLRAVREAGHPVVWACDPMHGNTFTSPSGPQDPPLRRHRPRDRRLRRRPPCRGHLAGRHPRRADRRERHRVPRRGRRGRPTISTTATRRCAIRASNGRQSLDLTFRVAELVAGPGADAGRRSGSTVLASTPSARWPVPNAAAAVVAADGQLPARPATPLARSGSPR